jgi:hypothetical protein
MVNNAPIVIASAAKQSILSFAEAMDCFVASLLAMTGRKKAGIAPGLLFVFPGCSAA